MVVLIFYLIYHNANYIKYEKFDDNFINNLLYYTSNGCAYI